MPSLALALAVGAASVLGAPPDAIVLLRDDGLRREILPTKRGGAELIQLDFVISGLGVQVRTDVSAGTATLTLQGREANLFHGKSLAAVGGDLRLLSSPAQYEAGQWLVPVDGLPKLLPTLLDRPVSWRPVQRALIVGNVPIPKLTVRNYVSGETVRVVFEASQKVPFQAKQESGRVTVAVPQDVLDVGFQEERFTGGIVERVQYLGGRENLFAVVLGPRFLRVSAYEQEGPWRLVLELRAAAGAADAPPATAPSAPMARESRPAPGGIRTVVIDPGHGGAEVGAQGPGGLFEKDVTLAVARKLRAALMDQLGLQVFLTRDGDQEVPLDERPAIANNYKADLFISIHTNAARSHGAAGSEVYFLSYQATDDESHLVALREGASIPQVSAPAGSDLAFILWDMAQADHLQESSALASRIQEELAELTGSEIRGVKQAPFRVLVGAAMPAVLVEAAFISNPEEEKLLGSSVFQGRVAAALMRGVAAYRNDRARRTGIGLPAVGPGSR